MLCCALYLLNRIGLAAGIGTVWTRSYLSDFLLIPCALPWLLWVHAWLGWRVKEAVPSVGEVMGHLVVWSIVAEWVGPRLFSHSVADWGDVAAYGAGGVLALCWWRLVPRGRKRAPHHWKLKVATGNRDE